MTNKNNLVCFCILWIRSRYKLTWLTDDRLAFWIVFGILISTSLTFATVFVIDFFNVLLVSWARHYNLMSILIHNFVICLIKMSYCETCFISISGLISILFKFFILNFWTFFLAFRNLLTHIDCRLFESGVLIVTWFWINGWHLDYGTSTHMMSII